MFKNIILLLVSLIFTLVLAEVVMRFTTPFQRGISWYHHDARYEFRHRSNLDAVTTEWGDGEPWRFQTNSHGFRGGEWRLDLKNSKYRLVITGDSFTVGDGVEEREAFPAVVGQLLWPSWEVINLGVSAWGPENALAYLETEGADLRGDCLLYAFFAGNDYLDHKRSRLFLYQDQSVTRWIDKKNLSAEDGQVPFFRRLARAIPVYDYLIQHSQLFNIIRNYAIRVLTHGRQVVAGNVVDPVANTDDALKGRITLTRESVQHTNAVMTALKRTAENSFQDFGVIIIPTKEQFITPAVTSRSSEKNARIGQESRSAILDWCNHHAVNCLDLFELLPHDPEQASQLYFKKDFHMSITGNSIVGELIASNVKTLCGKPDT